jgi:alpha-tubulin suppressor-like RCC1 family protein
VISRGAHAAAVELPALPMALGAMAALALAAGILLLGCDSRVEGTVLTPIGDDPDGGPNTCFTAVAAGAAATCVIHTGGELECFGSNELGQLGAATPASSGQRVRVDLGGPAVQVAAGEGYACARRDDDSLWCWGLTAGAAGQLGDGAATGSPTPIQVTALGNEVIDVAAGTAATCARTRDKSLWCWGDNSEGAVGVGDLGGITAPAPVTGFGTAEAVCTGGGHTCALASDGIIWCWGRNVDGETGTTLASADPVAAPATVQYSTTATAATAIACGAHHTCALLRGWVWCWGRNDLGQLGLLVSTPPKDVPAPVLALGTSLQVTAGGDHTCVRVLSGGVECFGSNEGGAMGYDAVTSPAYRPVPVAGLPSDVAAVSAGAYHNCVVTTVGDVWCWGDNGHGESVGAAHPDIEVTPHHLDCSSEPEPPI